MNPIDGFVRGRTAIPDSSGAPKSGGGDGAVPTVASGAAFGDVLSEVSKHDGGLGRSSPLPTSQAAAASTTRTAIAKIGVLAASENRFRPSDGNGADEIAADAAALNASAADLSSPLAALDVASAANGPAVVAADARGDQASLQSHNFGQARVAVNAGAIVDRSIGDVRDRLAIEVVKATKDGVMTDARPESLDARPRQRSRTSEAEMNGIVGASKKRVGNSSGLIASSVAGNNSDVSSDQITTVVISGAASTGIAPYQPPGNAIWAGPSIQPPRGRGEPDTARLGNPTPLSGVVVGSSMDLAASQPSAATLAMNSSSTPSGVPAPSWGNAATLQGNEAARLQAIASVEGPMVTSKPNPANETRLQGAHAAPGFSAPSGSVPSVMSPAVAAPSLKGSSGSFAAIAVASPHASQSSASPERSQIKLAMLDRQTHFPPIAELSPVHQIADRIMQEAAPLVASAGEAATSAAGISGAVPSQVLPTVMKILNLQLEPESLGAVTIRMRLSGSRLEVRVETARADTMRLISDDKDRLAEKLRSSAYALDSLVVKLAEQQTAHLQQGSGQTTASNTQGNVPTPSWRPSQEGGWSADDQSGARRESVSTQKRAREDAEDRSSGVNSSGAVYL